MNQETKLYFAFAGHARKISTDPLDSDNILNLAHMEQLVGTLVQEGRSGKQEPYLAKSWDIDPSKKKWTFELRKNLLSEDNSVISPSAFKKSLERSLKMYREKRGFVPVFSKLVGFDDFVEGGNSIKGIETTADKITFLFTSPVKTGLLEYLSMPYFGFYPEGNYVKDQWIDSSRIISSGAYQVKDFNADKGQVVLTFRKGWFSEESGSAQIVEINQISSEEIIDYVKANKGIVLSLHEESVPKDPDVLTMGGVPELIIAASLSPTEGIFKDPRARETFAKNLTRIKREKSSADVRYSDFFYPEFPGDPPVAANEILPLEIKCRPKILLKDAMNPALEADIREMMSQAMGLDQNEIDFIKLDRSDPDWMTTYTSNDKFDVRVVGVSIGGSVQKWVIEMMFCSKLGISFPDPSKRLCQLVEGFDSNDLDQSGFEVAFNKILAEDAAVLPIYHSGLKWSIHKSLQDKVAPTLGVPRFEMLKRVKD
ncbi:hypothetical protein GW915_00995 [bacterium]|nr:hypothetical protein [bacterium]